jgi:hypothetical protein
VNSVYYVEISRRWSSLRRHIEQLLICSTVQYMYLGDENLMNNLFVPLTGFFPPGIRSATKHKSVESLQSHMILTMSHWSSGLTCLLPATRVTGSNPLGGTYVKPGFSCSRCLATSQNFKLSPLLLYPSAELISFQ